jgi:hypothetical protein
MVNERRGEAGADAPSAQTRVGPLLIDPHTRSQGPGVGWGVGVS